jgi:predicted ATPase
LQLLRFSLTQPNGRDSASAILNPRRQISSGLANVTHLQAILGGCIREDYIYQVMEPHAQAGKIYEANGIVQQNADRLHEACRPRWVASTIRPHAGERVSDREAWLMRQLMAVQDNTHADNGKVVLDPTKLAAQHG